VTTPLPVTNLSGEIDHAVENLVDLGDDVDAINDQCGVAGEAKGDMEDGPVLRDVDVLAREHGVAMLFEARFSG
jgi:hypothetical protein